MVPHHLCCKDSSSASNFKRLQICFKFQLIGKCNWNIILEYYSKREGFFCVSPLVLLIFLVINGKRVIHMGYTFFWLPNFVYIPIANVATNYLGILVMINVLDIITAYTEYNFFKRSSLKWQKLFLRKFLTHWPPNVLYIGVWIYENYSIDKHIYRVNDSHAVPHRAIRDSQEGAFFYFYLCTHTRFIDMEIIETWRCRLSNQDNVLDVGVVTSNNRP